MINSNKKNYKEVLFYFLRLGCLGFGGPLAMIVSMHKDLVENRKWIDEEEFNSTFALIKAMPGPISFQTAVFLGRVRAGFFGGALAAFGLVTPAFILMILFSIFFKSMTELPFTQSIFLGMQVAALGVILGSLKGLVKNNIKDLFFWILVIISGIINYYHPTIEPIIIIGFGLFIILLKKIQRNSGSKLTLFSFFTPMFFFTDTIRDLFLVCFKAGTLVFGTGLAIVPMLQHDVVVKYKWLTHSEFLNALAFGQMTPGPVVITATFIGHKLAGFPGALIATIAIFGASFIHMSTWFPMVVKHLRGKIWINDFVFGAIAGVIGPIIVAVLKMGTDLPFNPFLATMVLVVFILTLTNKAPLWLLIPMGGVLNFLFLSVF